MNSESEIIAKLKHGVEGVEFISETESPVEVFVWREVKEITADYVRERSGKPLEALVSEMTVDEFFAAAISEYEGQSDVGRASAMRFRALVQIIKECLSDARVYLIGARRKDVFIIGRSADETVIGLRTQVVET